MKNKLLIFDMDGVLFDSIPIARDSFMRRYPSVTTDMYNEIHSGNFHEEVKKYSHLKIEETEEEKNKHKIIYSQKKSETPMFAGIENLLRELHKKGYLLVLNTNAQSQNSIPLLEHSKIISLFDFITTAELSKSKVEKFRLIEDKYKATKSDMLFVTDSLGDVREAEISGVRTIAVTWGVHNQSFFEREEHSNLVSIVSTVEELGNSIEQYLKI